MVRLSFEKMNPETIPDGVSAVSREAFGPDDYIDPGGSDYIVRDKKRVVAYATAGFESVESMDPWVHEVVESSLRPGDQIGWLSNVAVLKSHRGRGIASMLYRLRIDDLTHRNASVLLITGWVPRGKNRANVETLARRFKFEAVAEIEDFWLDESQQDRYSCTSCGTEDCHCSAVVYFRRIR